MKEEAHGRVPGPLIEAQRKEEADSIAGGPHIPITKMSFHLLV